jgi:hypothetical protein
MNACAILGAVVAVLVYIPLTINAWQGTVKLNFVTFLLWGLLDAIAAVSIALEGGNYLLPAIYVLCCFAILVAILHGGTFKWTWVETMTAILVVVCIIVWKTSGSTGATIASSLAVAVAGLPQLVDVWKNPRELPLWAYAGFTLANGASIFAGADWSIKERFYATTCTALTVVFLAVACRRWLPGYREQKAA